MMNFGEAKLQLAGSYITVPTMFHGDDLELDEAATRRVVSYILDGGFEAGKGVLLAGGAAGDFSTMTFDERVRTTEAVVAEAAGRIPVVMGAQSTSTRELVRLVKAAERVGAEYVQISCPYYFNHTEEDFYEFVLAASEAASVGIIIYNTFWTASGTSLQMVHRLAEIPNVVGLKWATPRTDAMEFERVITTFGEQMCVIDNQVQFASSFMMGASSFECHVCVYWPQWGVKMLDMLRANQFAQAQQEIVRVAVPFYQLWTEIETDYTSGDGYLDKLCLELCGLDSSRCRPPTRDIRSRYRDQTRRLLEECQLTRRDPDGHRLLAAAP